MRPKIGFKKENHPAYFLFVGAVEKRVFSGS